MAAGANRLATYVDTPSLDHLRRTLAAYTQMNPDVSSCCICQQKDNCLKGYIIRNSLLTILLFQSIMDAFEDGFGGEAEVDPAAEFLAKEQEELGDTGEG